MSDLTLDQRINRVLDAYGDDPEAGHAMEDQLLWEYVAEQFVKDGDADAGALLELRNTDRTRWYA